MASEREVICLFVYSYSSRRFRSSLPPSSSVLHPPSMPRHPRRDQTMCVQFCKRFRFTIHRQRRDDREQANFGLELGAVRKRSSSHCLSHHAKRRRFDVLRGSAFTTCSAPKSTRQPRRACLQRKGKEGGRSKPLCLLAPLPSTIQSTSSSMNNATTLRQRIAPNSKQPASSDKDDSSAERSCGSYPPFKPSRYTMKDLLGAVPAHCFERSAARSLYFVARDVAMIAGLAFATSWIEAAFGAHGLVKESEVLKWSCWVVYWMVQGVVFLGLLILGEYGELLIILSHADLVRIHMQATNVRALRKCRQFRRLPLLIWT